MAQKIRIRLKAYDHEIIDQSTKKIVETVLRTQATVRGPVPLPDREAPLHGDPLAAQVQGQPRALRDADPQAPARHRRAHAQDGRLAPAPRAAGRRRHRDQDPAGLAGSRRRTPPLRPVPLARRPALRGGVRCAAVRSTSIMPDLHAFEHVPSLARGGHRRWIACVRGRAWVDVRLLTLEQRSECVPRACTGCRGASRHVARPRAGGGMSGRRPGRRRTTHRAAEVGLPGASEVLGHGSTTACHGDGPPARGGRVTASSGRRTAGPSRSGVPASISIRRRTRSDRRSFWRRPPERQVAGDALSPVALHAPAGRCTPVGWT